MYKLLIVYHYRRDDLLRMNHEQQRNWKAKIMDLVANLAIQSQKIDTLFFSAVTETKLHGWETKHASIPDEIRSFLAQSDGLAADRGLLKPVWHLEQWEHIDDLCISGHPWVRFGEDEEYFYLLSLGHSPSIYRHAKDGSDEEFFASGFLSYLEKFFRQK